MSPLEHPVGWALVIAGATSPLWLTVVFVVQDWTRTVRRNRKWREDGYADPTAVDWATDAQSREKGYTR